MFWKRKPVTHAAALWIVVGLAMAGLIAALSFLSVLNGLRAGALVARPALHPIVNKEQAPSLIGTITSIEDSRLSIDSQQSFRSVLVDEDSSVSSVGGEKRSLSDLRVGAMIAATGKDLGRAELAAFAVVILDDR